MLYWDSKLKQIISIYIWNLSCKYRLQININSILNKNVPIQQERYPETMTSNLFISQSIDNSFYFPNI